jgi:hypothetical protein
VWAIPVGALNQGTLPRSRANDQGQFTIRIQNPGRYLVAASQEKEDYASAFLHAYGVQALPPPEVLIDEGQPRRSAVIRLGPRFGTIIGRVLDAETNRLVERGQVELQLRSESINKARSLFKRAIRALRTAGPFQPQSVGRRLSGLVRKWVEGASRTFRCST